jgi:hybrid cluster-associated redox disulfide protein
MTLDTIEPGLTIAELLSAYPHVIPVFVSHRMACVGCNMAAFESLGDAAHIYGILLDDLIDDLKTAQGQSTVERADKFLSNGET